MRTLAETMGDLNLQYYKSRSVRVLWAMSTARFVPASNESIASQASHIGHASSLSGTGALWPRASRAFTLAWRATAAAASGSAPSTGRGALCSYAQRLV